MRSSRKPALVAKSLSAGTRHGKHSANESKHNRTRLGHGSQVAIDRQRQPGRRHPHPAYLRPEAGDVVEIEPPVAAEVAALLGEDVAISLGEKLGRAAVHQAEGEQVEVGAIDDAVAVHVATVQDLGIESGPVATCARRYL